MCIADPTRWEDHEIACVGELTHRSHCETDCQLAELTEHQSDPLPLPAPRLLPTKRAWPSRK